MSKPRVFVDFNADLDQPPVAEAIPFLKLATNHFTVAIYSSRFEMEGGIERVKLYILNHALDLGQDVSFIGDIEWLTERPNDGVMVSVPIPPLQVPEGMTSEKLFMAISTELCREYAGNASVPLQGILDSSTRITHKFFPNA